MTQEEIDKIQRDNKQDSDILELFDRVKKLESNVFATKDEFVNVAKDPAPPTEQGNTDQGDHGSSTEGESSAQ
jgi:hypothetical protein